MPEWTVWVLVGVLAWSLIIVLLLGFLALSRTPTVEAVDDQHAEPEPAVAPEAAAAPEPEPVAAIDRRRILVVDDDAGLRLLLRTTLTADEFSVEEAVSAEEAREVARFWSPGTIILDVGLPGMDGLTFCRELKQNPVYGSPHVILLTGQETTTTEVRAAGPDAVLGKPFSPLELIRILSSVGEAMPGAVPEPPADDAEQLLIYARDLNRLLEIERTQRRLLQHAYRETATALADALEAKDPVTGLHALRVQRYASELTRALDPSLLEDPSLEYGFLLHDIGKLGVPDTILQKPGPLTRPERLVMQQHTRLGAEILAGVALLQGEGLKVVRSHHERWDGAGYPDGLEGREIPAGARIFALVDAVDAMTSDRPYRNALGWEQAVDEILAQSGQQFDPRVVAAFAGREWRMRRICEELAETAA
jgi:response regulator RpfG family c-di-GMP phosphodiesterase